jgi:hypothetical protein
VKDELTAWRVRVYVFSQTGEACAFGMDDIDEVNQFLQGAANLQGIYIWNE